MLPFCDRVVSVPRKDVAPVWTRSFPIAKEPTTLGQHLKKKRFLAGVRQREAALKLGFSARTLSLWECDRIYPSWAFQPLLIAYLGYDPFTEPTLGSPKRNETSCVALLSPDAPITVGQKIKQSRLKLRKTRKQMALELGVSVKTLWGWETNRRKPATLGQKQIAKLLQWEALNAKRNPRVLWI
jgi:transcriptional regulator with XRE-family HTH domain